MGIQELFPGGDMHNIDLGLEVGRAAGIVAQLLPGAEHDGPFLRAHTHPAAALAGAEKGGAWMLERLERSDGLGAIYPGIMNSIIALRCLGYSLDDPQMIRAMDEFEALGIEEEDTFRMQPCKSPVWDTVYAMFALGEAGVPRDDPRMVAAADWVLKKQVTHRGDWSVKNPNVAPAGWYFEFNNEFYPDVDDTAQVNLALEPRGPSQRALSAASRCERAIAVGAGHAVQGRRLGLLRPGQHPHGVPVRALRRPQRHAGPADGGHYRARAGNAGGLRLRARASGDAAGHRVHQGSSRSPTEAGSGAGA